MIGHAYFRICQDIFWFNLSRMDARCLWEESTVKNLSIIRYKRWSAKLISEFAKVYSIFRETIAVVLFHVQQPRHYVFVIRQNTNRAPRYSALDVIKIFRARMKSYRSTWFVILVARYRVTIAKLHSLSDPLPSARTFLPAIYHRESCRVGFLRLWSNR